MRLGSPARHCGLVQRRPTAVITLRNQVMPAEATRIRLRSVAESSWPDAIPADRPAMVIADGLFAFLPEAVIIGIFGRVTEHFGSGELAFNDYGHVNRLNIAAMKIVFSAVGTQWAYQGFNDAHVPESWSPRLRLVEETSLSHAAGGRPVSARRPGYSTRLMGMTKSGARTARILRYRF